jgi:hypothetical protein
VKKENHMKGKDLNQENQNLRQQVGSNSSKKSQRKRLLVEMV